MVSNTKCCLIRHLWPAVEAAKRTSLRLINLNDEGPRGISRAEPGVGAPPPHPRTSAITLWAPRKNRLHEQKKSPQVTPSHPKSPPGGNLVGQDTMSADIANRSMKTHLMVHFDVFMRPVAPKGLGPGEEGARTELA